MGTVDDGSSESPSRVSPASKPVSEVDHVAIRFAGDSGDGMQITGSKFTDTTALF